MPTCRLITYLGELNKWDQRVELISSVLCLSESWRAFILYLESGRGVNFGDLGNRRGFTRIGC